MFYVTILDGKRVSFALGPFDHHEEALACVETVRMYVLEHYMPQAWFWAYGTSRIKEGPYPEGKLNAAL